MFGPVTRRLLRDAGRHGPVALMYHSVQVGEPDWRWAVSQRRFRAHLDVLLEAGWSTVPFSALGGGQALPARSVAITFDDGYLDNLAAVEALTERRMTATWFVVSGEIGGRARWLRGARASMPLLSALDLQTMCAAGMEIGSHTRSHECLPSLDEYALADEVAGSRRELEDLLGCEVTSFAYPYGAHDPASVQAVAQAGYRAACTTRSGWALRQKDPLRINRLTMYADDGEASLARKLALGSNDGDWLAVARYGLSRFRF